MAAKRWLTCALLACMVLAAPPGRPATAADDLGDARLVVEKAILTIQEFTADPMMGGFRDVIKRARGVFIAPDVLRVALLFGGSGGAGVLLARDPGTDQWSYPAFYTLATPSFGFQAGIDVSDVVLLMLTERGVNAMLGSTVKLGADASVATGPVGVGVSASTAAFSADIVAFSRARGLYGGVSVDGSIVATRGDWNDAYYGRSVSPVDILIRRTVTSPHAMGLLEALAKAAASGK